MRSWLLSSQASQVEVEQGACNKACVQHAGQRSGMASACAAHKLAHHRASYCTTRLVRFLYSILYPHSRQRMTSPGLSVFSAPQSPQM